MKFKRYCPGLRSKKTQANKQNQHISLNKPTNNPSKNKSTASDQKNPKQKKPNQTKNASKTNTTTQQTKTSNKTNKKTIRKDKHFPRGRNYCTSKNQIVPAVSRKNVQQENNKKQVTFTHRLLCPRIRDFNLHFGFQFWGGFFFSIS